jgi:hypothetical protein
VAVDATARLYDVDEDSVVFKRLDKTDSYDQGVFTFRARKGKLIDLDKLHESIWATRLSGGTRSGLVSLEVVAIGKLINTQNGVILRVAGADAEFVLAKSTTPEHTEAFSQLMNSEGNANRLIKVTGVIDNYQGRWPTLFEKQPDKVRRILVTGHEVVE